MKRYLLIILYCLSASFLFPENITILPFENQTGEDSLKSIVMNMEDITAMNLLLLDDYTLLDAPGFQIAHELNELKSFAEYSKSRLLIIGEQYYRDNELIIGISMYDDLVKNMVFEERHEVPSILDSFEITDGIVLRLMTKIVGNEVHFASFNLEKTGSDADYLIFLNGIKVGENSTEINNIISGKYFLKIVTKRNGVEEILFEKEIELNHSTVETYSFNIPETGESEMVLQSGMSLDFSDLQLGDRIGIETIDGFIYEGSAVEISNGEYLVMELPSGAKVKVPEEKITVYENISEEERTRLEEERIALLERKKNRVRNARLGIAFGPLYYPDSGYWMGPSGASFDIFSGIEANLSIDIKEHHSLLFSFSQHGYWGDYPILKTDHGTAEGSEYNVNVYQDTRKEWLAGYGYRLNLSKILMLRPSLYCGVLEESRHAEFVNTTLDLSEWYDQREYDLKFTIPALVGSMDVFFFYSSMVSFSVSGRYYYTFYGAENDFTAEIPGTSEEYTVNFDSSYNSFSLRLAAHFSF